MKNISFRFPLYLFCFTLLVGCATMFNGSSQQIEIQSNISGTELYVNETYVGNNRSVVVFEKKRDYVITARKTGCADASVAAAKSFDATTLLGILVDWGLISILIVDGVSTGAWQEFEQTSYVLDPVC